jgi:transcriptional regulator with XRE-family HTH domain
MKVGASGSFGSQLKALRETAGFTQEELATIAGLSVHAVSALERGERRRPQVGTVRALSAALDLTDSARDALLASARGRPSPATAEELARVGLPAALTALIGREADLEVLWQWLADHTMRLMTLTGPGGAGKTRLALELVRGAVDAGLTRVVFIAVIRGSDQDWSRRLSPGARLADVTARDLPIARVVCEDRSTLLVLDNFEHVLDAAPLVADLPDIGRIAPNTDYQPRATPPARRARVRRRTSRAAGGLGAECVDRSRILSRGAALRGTRSRGAT